MLILQVILWLALVLVIINAIVWLAVWSHLKAVKLNLEDWKRSYEILMKAQRKEDNLPKHIKEWGK